MANDDGFKDEFLPKDILENAHDALDWEEDSNVERLAGSLIILLRGILERLMQESDDEQ
jgi:hypothetical protein